METCVEERSAAGAADPESDSSDGDCPQHHKPKARIPIPDDIEEAQHFRRIDHLRDCEAKAEQKTGKGRGEEAAHGSHPAKPCRTMTATVTPTAMNSVVASSERCERRA